MFIFLIYLHIHFLTCSSQVGNDQYALLTDRLRLREAITFSASTAGLELGPNLLNSQGRDHPSIGFGNETGQE